MTPKALCGYSGMFLVIAGVALIAAEITVRGVDLAALSFEVDLIRKASFQTAIVGFGVIVFGVILVMVSGIGQKAASGGGVSSVEAR